MIDFYLIIPKKVSKVAIKKIKVLHFKTLLYNKESFVVISSPDNENVNACLTH